MQEWSMAKDHFGLKVPKPCNMDGRYPWSQGGQQEGCCSGDLNYVDNLGESRNSYHHGEVQYQPQKSVELVEELLKALEVPAL